MRNPSSFKNSLGSNQILDLKNRLQLQLPDNYRIYNHLPGIWIGGSENGAVYLHLERIPAYALELSKNLAGGDLDIQVSSQGKGQVFEEGVAGQYISCQLRQETLDGIWLRVVFNRQDHYLILLAAREPAFQQDLQEKALELAMQIKSQVPTKFIKKSSVSS